MVYVISMGCTELYLTTPNTLILQVREAGKMFTRVSIYRTKKLRHREVSRAPLKPSPIPSPVLLPADKALLQISQLTAISILEEPVFLLWMNLLHFGFIVSFIGFFCLFLESI